MRTIKALLIVAILVSGCGPRCLKGHDEPVWIPEYCYPTYTTIPVGRDQLLTIPTGQSCIPAHWSTHFICDQYELEKEG